eukprot:CAMPEP_0170565116 /NCGR_PEP_ID=MMETSP0211-20121228/76847_1 /TAXON_ID=311385 /ORGANISM="Pseudokeronopsis sp., Strain OXSARD2" /LENGTH=75 /DNA_ID=CAMNT_0010885483 /DNA_START=386 /DNA_END=613 /DNA_ORIENTATION=-
MRLKAIQKYFELFPGNHGSGVMAFRINGKTVSAQPFATTTIDILSYDFSSYIEEHLYEFGKQDEVQLDVEMLDYT